MRSFNFYDVHCFPMYDVRSKIWYLHEILTGRHFAGLQNIMNINEVQRSNGVTRRNLVV